MWFFVPALLLLATDFTAEGMKALEDRKYEEAVALFVKAVAADPGDTGRIFIWPYRIACSTSRPRRFRFTRRF